VDDSDLLLLPSLDLVLQLLYSLEGLAAGLGIQLGFDLGEFRLVKGMLLDHGELFEATRRHISASLDVVKQLVFDCAGDRVELAGIEVKRLEQCRNEKSRCHPVV